MCDRPSNDKFLCVYKYILHARNKDLYKNMIVDLSCLFSIFIYYKKN